MELRTAPSHRLAAWSSAPSPAHRASCTAREPGGSEMEVAAGRVLTSPGEPWLLGQTPELRGKGAVGQEGVQETDPEDSEFIQLVVVRPDNPQKAGTLALP